MCNTEISRRLAALSFPALEIPGSEGGTILAAAAGGRVLRLTGPRGADFLWLHPDLAQGNAVPADPASGWRNLGGDRTWIAPEYDLFAQDPADPWNTYRVPSSFDPGSYEIGRDAAGIGMSAECTVRNHRLKAEGRIRVEKHVEARPRPPEAKDAADVEYIGYGQTTTLRLLDSTSPVLRLGLWHLAQLPSPGEMLVPTHRPAHPRIYFGSADDGQIAADDGGVRFRANGRKSCKIGIRADAVTGRTGFVRRYEDGSAVLVVRDAVVMPQKTYVDPPWDNLEETGYAIQCFSAGAAHSFAELEYHCPAVGNGAGADTYTDRSELWGFRGDAAAVAALTEQLLGMTFARE